jgi:hypothetical protein
MPAFDRLWPEIAPLRNSSRYFNLLPATRSLYADVLLAAAAGALAACMVALVDLNLRLPGHSILKAALPLAMGFALVPRRATGMMMTVSALATLYMLRSGMSASVGGGSTTSLLALGPLVDVCLWRAKAGWGLVARFAAAGLLANLLAFAVRGGNKTWLEFGLRPWDDWVTVAPWTYAICGLLAGLLGAWCCFRAGSVPRSSTGGKRP